MTYNTKYKKTNDIKKDILTIDGAKRSMSVFYELTKDYYEEGVEKGIKQGMQEGILNTLISLVKEGLLSVNDAAKKRKMSEEEFKKLLTT